MKMFKKFLILGFLLLSITALSKAQEEETTPEPTAETTPAADPATTPADELSKDDKKSKGKAGKNVIDDIMAFMKKTCESIMTFLEGKEGKKKGGSDAPAKNSTATEDESVPEDSEADDDADDDADPAESGEDAVSKTVKKPKKALDNIVKVKNVKKDSDESEEAED